MLWGDFSCFFYSVRYNIKLKYNKTVKTAADQIRERNYPQLLEHYAGNTLLVSINYNKDATGDEFKKHSCKIERL